MLFEQVKAHIAWFWGRKPAPLPIPASASVGSLNAVVGQLQSVGWPNARVEPSLTGPHTFHFV